MTVVAVRRYHLAAGKLIKYKINIVFLVKILLFNTLARIVSSCLEIMGFGEQIGDSIFESALHD